MKTIHKFNIAPMEAVQTFQLPKGAEIISFNSMSATDPVSDKTATALFFWVLVDTDAPHNIRRLLCVGTGWPIEPNVKRVVGTVITGPYVWHLLEVN